MLMRMGQNPSADETNISNIAAPGGRAAAQNRLSCRGDFLLHGACLIK